MNTKDSEVIFILSIFILMFFAGFASAKLYDELLKRKMLPHTSCTSILQSIVEKEVSNISIPNGTCLDYATYFNKTFVENYPELDVTWDEYICLDDVRNCTSAHTYIVVAGYNSLCILNSKRYECVDFIKGV